MRIENVVLIPFNRAYPLGQFRKLDGDFGWVLIPFNRAYPLGPFVVFFGVLPYRLNPVQQGISARTNNGNLWWAGQRS